jgi:rubredoxin
MIFGPKDDGSPGDYVCKDCGYVFTKGPAAWAALPSDYSCPPCGSSKWRFAKVPKGSANAAAKGKAGGAKPAAPPAKKGFFG